jgi:hypothetical protein
LRAVPAATLKSRRGCHGCAYAAATTGTEGT